MKKRNALDVRGMGVCIVKIDDEGFACRDERIKRIVASLLGLDIIGFMSVRLWSAFPTGIWQLR